LSSAGFDVELPQAAIYLWARLPAKFDDPVKFCADLLDETGVSLTPGIIYGPSGKDYIRISIVTPTDSILEAVDRLTRWVAEK
jgi:LL-diaminopimelate aminotransferase